MFQEQDQPQTPMPTNDDGAMGGEMPEGAEEAPKEEGMDDEAQV